MRRPGGEGEARADGPIVRAIITTLDNCPMLRRQVAILSQDPLVQEIVVVNNGSEDDTADYLMGLLDRPGAELPSFLAGRHEGKALTVVNRENNGAGPGRNAGIDIAFPNSDYMLFLDGGIRPLFGGTQRMLDYLEANPGVDSVAANWPDLATNEPEAWHRWPDPIEWGQAYHHRSISQTHYALVRRRAFDGIRFAEHGPFGQPGWGCDDDELMHRWLMSGIVVHAVQGIRAYRRASGSFARLHRETGIWPNQYGSVYEKRLVWLQQNQPQFGKGMQWGEPWLTVVIKARGVEATASLVRRAHDQLRLRKFAKPWGHWPNPYSVIVWGGAKDWLLWALPRSLRQHHGDTLIDSDGQIVRRDKKNERLWTGDFRMWLADDWREAIRPGAFYYGLVHNRRELDTLLEKYNEVWPHQPENTPPPGLGREDAWLSVAGGGRRSTPARAGGIGGSVTHPRKGRSVHGDHQIGPGLGRFAFAPAGLPGVVSPFGGAARLLACRNQRGRAAHG